MALIKINLLGKKKVSAPFGIDKLLEKSGIKLEDLSALKIPLLRVAVIVIGVYLAGYIPETIQERELAELDQKLSVVTKKADALQKEVTAKKEIRRQMDQLTKEENELTRQLNIISSLSKNRSNAFNTFDTLTSLIPAKVWVNRLDYMAGKISMEGASWEYFPINDFMKALNESLFFQDVNLKGIAAEATGKPIPGVPAVLQKIKSFELNMSVKDKN